MGTDTDRYFIERMTWDEVARHIAAGAAAILPIGAAAKQHGFHLPLNTDRLQAEWQGEDAAHEQADFDAIDAMIDEMQQRSLANTALLAEDGAPPER